MSKTSPAKANESAISIAIAGATGLIGGQLLEILTEKKRAFPYAQLYLLASEDSLGKSIDVHGKMHRVQSLASFDFSQVDLAFFCLSSKITQKYALEAVEKGCWVIDQSSLFRYQDHIPLIIPEINGRILDRPQYANTKLIANPNCSTIQLLMALYPIAREVSLARVDVATYQAVSGAGHRAEEELITQTGAVLTLKAVELNVFEQQIAFNVLPHIDDWQDNGFTREEMKVVWETEKILGSVCDISALEINVTAARVPVLTGHAEAVHVETESPVTVEEVASMLKSMPGVHLMQAPEYPTPVSDAACHDEVFVGRLRQRLGARPGFNFWVVADNLRKGGSLNAVQIAELLLQKGRLTASCKEPSAKTLSNTKRSAKTLATKKSSAKKSSVKKSSAKKS